VAEIEGFDLRQFLVDCRAARDLLSLDLLAGLLIAATAPSRRGWMLSCPGVAMNRATKPLSTNDAMRSPIL
jgi:hypothetical protein